jgi:methionine aminotransferase
MSKWLQSMTQLISRRVPNFPVDTVLTDIVIRLAKNNVHQYLPMAGYPPLLSNIALLVKKSYRRILLPEIEILVTAGLHKPYLQLFKLW